MNVTFDSNLSKQWRMNQTDQNKQGVDFVETGSKQASDWEGKKVKILTTLISVIANAIDLIQYNFFNLNLRQK